MNSTATGSIRTLWWLALMLGVVWLATLGYRPLFNPDEGRYADIPLEMLTRHDFIVPHLNGLVYLEKPPLQYWVTAAIFSVFPVNEWSARLVLGLSYIAIALWVFRLATTLYGRERATVALFMCASGLLMQLMATLLTLDLSLTLWMTMATVCLCEAQLRRDTHPALTRRWMMACYLAMGLATLTKGLIGLVLPGLSLLIYTALTRDWALWRHLHLLVGSLVYGVVVLPWFWAVESHHPGALQFLIIHEHFQRYLTTIHERYRPVWYFFALLLPSLLPFSLSGLRALWRRQLLQKASRFDAERLLWSLATLILLFFSLSDSKLPPYILPMMPLLAILASGHSERAWQADQKANATLVIILGVVMMGLALHGLDTDDRVWLTHLDKLRMNETLTPWLLGFGGVLVATGLLTLRIARPLPSSALLASGFLVSGIVLFHGVTSELAYRYSAKDIVGHTIVDPADPVYTLNTFDWTLPFYLRHTAIPVNWRGELDYGLNDQPTRGRATVSQFEAEWKNLPQGYALMPRDVHNQLQKSGLPMTVQAYDFDNVWVSRH